MPLSITIMQRFFGLSVAIVDRQPICINSEPSPSSAKMRRLGWASATPSAIGKARLFPCSCDCSLVEDFAAGQQRRQDQRHRRLRRDGLFDRSIDDELELV